MTNFDFLKSTPDFDTFANVAISAENKKNLEKLETLKKALMQKYFG